MQEQNRKVYPQTSLCHLDTEDAFDQSVCEDPLESMFHSVERSKEWGVNIHQVFFY